MTDRVKEELEAIRDELTSELKRRVDDALKELKKVSDELTRGVDDLIFDDRALQLTSTRLEVIVQLATAGEQKLSQIVAVLMECRMRGRNQLAVVSRLESLRKELPAPTAKSRKAIGGGSRSRIGYDN